MKVKPLTLPSIGKGVRAMLVLALLLGMTSWLHASSHEAATQIAKDPQTEASMSTLFVQEETSISLF